jgi:DNA-nicking Smr family endonuclease
MTKDDDEKDGWSHYAQGIKRLGPNTPQTCAIKKKKPTASVIAQTILSESKTLDQTPETKVHDSMESLLSQRGPTASEIAQQEKKKKQKQQEESQRLTAPPALVAAPQAILAPPAKDLPKEPLDLRIERNLSLGDVVIEARIDLHGHTEQEAHEKLIDFLEAAYQRGRRVVLVITGKGVDNGSVLRQNMPRWCDVPPLSQIVLAIREAAAHHGGDGAYYVVIRKRERMKGEGHGL